MTLFTPPRSIRFRFSLRTLFVGVTLAAILPWLAHNAYWIHERNVLVGSNSLPLEGETRAPWPLWLVGVQGYARIRAKVPPGNVAAIQQAAREGKIHYQRVFPEAEVIVTSNVE